MIPGMLREPMHVFIQMSGVPGAGKTTIARAVAGHIGAVVVDHDVTKTALLDADIPAADAGYASYMVLDAVARHVLAQGFSVVFDSPCLYAELLERGQQLAATAGAAYRYIECRIDDLDELDRRLRTRTRSRSQLAGVYAAPTEGSGKAVSGAQVFREAIANMKRPAEGYLLLDTSRPVEVCVREAIAYVTSSSRDQLPLLS